MSKKIHVIILDDHQSIADGYCFRLSRIADIEVVTTLLRGDELEPALAQHPVDVLLLDVHVPTAADNPAPYPILHMIPRVLQTYPGLNILVISMTAERGLIRAVMEAGASGYLLKDDQESIQNLGNIVLDIAHEGVYFSPQAHELFERSQMTAHGPALTPRQLEVLSLCLAFPNASTSDLADKLVVAQSTLRNLLSGAYIKLDVRNRQAAVAKARQLGLITPEPPVYSGN